jgi:hypothetical protein
MLFCSWNSNYHVGIERHEGIVKRITKFSFSEILATRVSFYDATKTSFRHDVTVNEPDQRLSDTIPRNTFSR